MSFPKHFLLTVFIISGCSHFTFAQKENEQRHDDFTVEWGPDVKLKHNSTTMNNVIPDEILLYGENGFYVTAQFANIVSSRPYFDLVKFNNKLEMVGQNVILTEDGDEKASGHKDEAFLEFNKKIYVVSKEKMKSEKRVDFFIETVDLNSLEPKNDKKKIYSIDYSIEKNRDIDIMKFTVDDEKKFIVIYDEHYSEKETNVAVTVTVLNNSLAKMWSKEIELPFITRKKGSMNFDTYIDPGSNFYIVAKVYREGEKQKKDVSDGELTYDYHVYKIGKDIKNYIDYPFSLKDKAVSQVKLNVNNKGDLVACGIYADINEDKDKVSPPKGIFFTVIDPENNKIKSQNYKEFTSDAYTTGLKTKDVERVEKRLEEGEEMYGWNFIIQDLIPRKDGGSLLIAEEYRRTEYSDGKTTRITYSYKNIFISKISQSGNVEWVKVIPKFQVGSGLGKHLCSYFLFDQGNDSYRIFFNDNRENLIEMKNKSDGIAKMTNIKKGTMVSILLSADGSISKRKEAIKLPPKEDDTMFFPVLGYTPNDNEIIMFGLNHGKDKFARLSFETK